jgi:hypothetical protein
MLFPVLALSIMGSCKNPGYHRVMARENAKSNQWRAYTAKTIDRLPGFCITPQPETDRYGGWKVDRMAATGFFRTEKIDGRWWIVDPEGHPFIHRGVAVYRPGRSTRQRESLASKYGDLSNWVKDESAFLLQHGFNGAGAWSDHNLIREHEVPIVYTIILNPMGNYRSEHIKRYGGKYDTAGWQGYRYDLVMVFDPQFDEYVERAIAPIAQYTGDKYLLGYYTDNELPWKNDALDRHLTCLSPGEPGYIAARAWLSQRKGADADIFAITDDDRQAFTGFYFETYMRKVEKAIRKYDPNHLYLGCRFNQEQEELVNPEIFRIAGKYMDIVSVNHYRKWQPSVEMLTDWETWSNKPFLITEWYTKGEDSGLPNETGAGWNVPTQKERGYFYQNFVIELLKSKGCVGWHWFTYQDNDPEDLSADPSNRDSNKGIVDSRYNPYTDLLYQMKTVNNQVFNLIRYFDSAEKTKSPPCE